MSYLTEEEAAACLHITVDTLRAWAAEGRIGTVRFGSETAAPYFSPDEVNRVIEERVPKRRGRREKLWHVVLKPDARHHA